MTPKELRSQVLKRTGEELSDLGFKKRKSGIFTKPLSSDSIGWVGLNMASRGPESLEINPVVGIRHQPTERLFAELIGERFHPYLGPTLSMHLGYLMPDSSYRPYLFPAGEDPTEHVRDLVLAIRKFGLPFMENNLKIENIVSSMLNCGYGIKYANDYRLPVIYYLLGCKKRAEAYVEKRLDEIRGDDDLAAEHYRLFAAALQQRMNG